MTVHGDDISTVWHVTNRCRKLKNCCTSILIITPVMSAQQRCECNTSQENDRGKPTSHNSRLICYNGVTLRTVSNMQVNTRRQLLLWWNL